MINLFKPFVSEYAIDLVNTTLRSGYIAQGPVVDKFEDCLKQVLNVSNIVTVNSGTSSLFLAYKLIKDELNLSDDTEVLATPITCFASNAAILHNGLKVKWVDVDEATLNISLSDVRKKWTENTRILSITSWGGYPINMWKLRELKDDYKKKFHQHLHVVLDLAHAWGSTFAGRQIPTLDKDIFYCYSFQAIKSLTSGDGGLLVTPDWAYRRARLLRWFGLDRDNKVDFRHCLDISDVGYKLHMNDISASIAIGNLPYVMSDVVSKQKKNSLYLKQQIQGKQGTFGPCITFGSSCWLHTIYVDNSKRFIEYMRANGIEANPVHTRNDKLSVFSGVSSNLQVVDRTEERRVCIPCGWHLTIDELEKVVEIVNAY